MTRYCRNCGFRIGRKLWRRVAPGWPKRIAHKCGDEWDHDYAPMLYYLKKYEYARQKFMAGKTTLAWFRACCTQLFYLHEQELEDHCLEQESDDDYGTEFEKFWYVNRLLSNRVSSSKVRQVLLKRLIQGKL